MITIRSSISAQAGSALKVTEQEKRVFFHHTETYNIENHIIFPMCSQNDHVTNQTFYYAELFHLHYIIHPVQPIQAHHVRSYARI